MDSLNIKTVVICGIAAGVSVAFLRSWLGRHAIPSIDGGDGPIASYLSALRFMKHANTIIATAYRTDRTGVFRYPTLFRWDYLANGVDRIAEIADVPEDVLSFHEAAKDSLQTVWTMGRPIADNPYHVHVVRGSLTRNLARCFPAVRDEIVHAFNDVLAFDDYDWHLIPVMPTTMQVVARTSNRLFVGLPLCRVPEYLNLSIAYTITVIARGRCIRLIPEALKPLLAPLFSTQKSSLRHALKFLGPFLEERIQQDELHGRDRPGRPNDLVSWLLDAAPDAHERTAPALALRILAINMAAIHTSSMTLTTVLYDLAAYPTHIAPLRAEVECVVAREGWSKAALGSMHKVDSFIRESQRMTGLGPLAMGRRVVAPDGYTFADGTTIPYGAYMRVSGTATQFDPEFYEDPDVFDGFRFSRMREAKPRSSDAAPAATTSPLDDSNQAGTDEAGADSAQGSRVFNRQMISTSPTHVIFGHGHHACPGRFFAATELKAMLAHVLLNYDVRAEVEGAEGRPKPIEMAASRSPNPKGKIWIRRRAESSVAQT